VVAPDLPRSFDETVLSNFVPALATNSEAIVTNITVAEVDFGTNQDELIYAQRSDESFVYTVRLEDFQGLPFRALQLRDRTVWNFSTNDVTRLTVQQNGKTRQWLRKGMGNWSLAPGFARHHGTR